MKQTILFFTAIIALCTNASAQYDSLEVRAEKFYNDFVYCHGGYRSPYEPFDWSDDDKSLRQPKYEHNADSALALFYELYQREGYEHLYFPIVQLEHFLGLRHDIGVVEPDTADYYMPLQSHTYDNLGPGWETDYSQYLFPHTRWALGSCEWYTRFFTSLGEPDLWHQSSGTVLRMTVTHLPVATYSLIRVFLRDGKPFAVRRFVYSRYASREDWEEGKSNFIPDGYDERALTHKQWLAIQVMAAAIDTLPWETKGTAIDGNRYQFEYRHGSSYHSHYSCHDRTGLSEYLYNLFEKPKQIYDEDE